MLITYQEEFTDENGNFIINIGDHINYRYEIISELGTGSFGQVKFLTYLSGYQVFRSQGEICLLLKGDQEQHGLYFSS
jgi:hypothetical protein